MYEIQQIRTECPIIYIQKSIFIVINVKNNCKIRLKKTLTLSNIGRNLYGINHEKNLKQILIIYV